jgi:hypothetical protein
VGTFHVHCVETGLALRAGVRLLPIVQRDRGYAPLAGSIIGLYDAYGGVDLLSGDARARCLADELRAWCPSPIEIDPSGRRLWRALSNERSLVRHRGRVVTYVLFDAGVAEVIERGTTMVELVERLDVFGRGYSEADRALVAAMTARGTDLRPIWETYGGQYAEHDAAQFIGAARDRYGSDCSMLAAIDANERTWRD